MKQLEMAGVDEISGGWRMVGRPVGRFCRCRRGVRGFDFEDVDDSGECVVLFFELVVLRDEFLDSVKGRGEVVAELTFVIGDVAACTDAGIELVLEIGVTVGELMPFDARLVGERDDGE
jgi:hypothetical protein